MDADELKFIIGHELGHVKLGHTWLNSLVGGVAGVPSPIAAAVILNFAFLWWNRACEYSADRAGLLACGKPEKAFSALVKITGKSLQQLDAEDDSLMGNLTESISTHPMIIKRIQELKQWAQTEEYRRLQAGVNQNR
jgi:Zn-dependent protease with chaperone function